MEAICKVKHRVDADTVLDPEAPQALIALVRKLQSLQVRQHIIARYQLTQECCCSPQPSLAFATCLEQLQLLCDVSCVVSQACMLLSLQEEAEAEGASQPDMMDPIADLKLNQLDIVDAVRERQARLQVSL